MEMLLLFGTGYICGLGVSSGFAVSVLNQKYVAGNAKWRHVAWLVVALVNALVVSVCSVLLIVVVVVGDDIDRPDFWARVGMFAVGLLLGSALIIFCAKLLNERMNGGGSQEVGQP